ncbi:MAG: hypothetical protein NTW14_06745 [bacterium]|nr:hypothetical protein [bacterium]
MADGMRSVWRIVAVGFLVLNLAGCDLFKTRPTEPPNMGGTPWIYPLSVDQVFANLTQAISESNSDHYLRCLFSPDDSSHVFLFVPNPNVSGWPTTDPWGYAEEQETIQRLFTLESPANSAVLLLEEDGRLIYPNQDSAWVSQNYTLTVPTTDQNLPQQVSGRSDFYLAKNATGYWAIYRWEDVEGNPSWTDLKAGLY